MIRLSKFKRKYKLNDARNSLKILILFTQKFSVKW